MKKSGNLFVSLFLVICVILSLSTPVSAAKEKITLDNIPAYKDNPYVEINNNVPSFKKSELVTKSFEKYSELDDLGRCSVAYANIGKDLMPTEERGNIGMIKPSGWQTVKYKGLIDGNYLYNRCHLIGYQLSGENDNELNLITGTRYMNTEGMLPFENKVANYVKKTDNHVLYRVTPVFKGDNLVCSGVQIEAYSVEDKGKGVSFNVYCYNVQPGIIIDYSNGDSKLSGDGAISISLDYKRYTLKVGDNKTFKAVVTPDSAKNSVTWFSSNTKVATVSSNGKVTAIKAGTAVITAKTANGKKAACTITVKGNSSAVAAPSDSTEKSTTYILNTNTKKFHIPSCSSVGDMAEKNKKEYTGSRDDVIAQGYVPCMRCCP